jgi:Putative MetA-pathway of phenol degradation
MRRRHLTRARGGGLALAVLALAGSPARAAEPREGPPPFFDAVVSISPGISREVDVLFDHVRASDGQLTQLSVRLQYPLLPWFQVALEVPVILQDPSVGATTAGAGDIVLGGQARVWVPQDWPTEIDVGLDLTLPTGGESVLAGSTAVRPFVAAGTKLGSLDVLANVSYQWIVAGPVARTELFQATLAVGYPLRWVAPFFELTLLKPVRGFDDFRPQVAVVPGIEVFLPWNLSLSVGVQLSLGPQRLFDQRVLAFFKWPF